MNKLKLILLSSIFLAGQLNCILIKFNNTPVPVDVYPERLNTLFNNQRMVQLPIKQEEFNRIMEILIRFKQVDEDVAKNPAAKEDAVKYIISELRRLHLEDVQIIRQIQTELNIPLLNEALRSFEQAPSNVQKQSQGLKSLAQPDVNDFIRQQRIIHFTKPTSAGSQASTELGITPEIQSTSSQTCWLKISDTKEKNENGTEEHPYCITKQQAILSKVLKTMLEVSAEQEKINLPKISPEVFVMLMPFWNLSFELENMALDPDITSKMIDNKQEALNTLITRLTFQQLDILLGALNFLDIKLLFDAFIKEITRRLSTTEGLNIFRMHPAMFLGASENHFNFAIESLYPQIILAMSNCPLLEGEWIQDREIIIPNDITSLSSADHLFGLSNRFLGLTEIKTTTDNRIITVGAYDAHRDRFNEFSYIKTKQRIIVRIPQPDGSYSFVVLKKSSNLNLHTTVMPDDRILITGERTGEITICNPLPDNRTYEFHPILPYEKDITSMVTLPENQIVISYCDGTIKILTINSDNSFYSIDFPIKINAKSIHIMPNKNILIASNDKLIQIWKINSSATTVSCIKTVETIPYRSLKIIDNENLLLFTNDQLIRLKLNLDATTNYTKITNNSSNVAIMSDGRILTTDDGVISIFTPTINEQYSFIKAFRDYTNPAPLYSEASTEFEENKIVNGQSEGFLAIFSNWNTITRPINSSQNLNLVQILFINSCKLNPIDLRNEKDKNVQIFKIIFESLNPRIQKELRDKHLIIEH